jgi:PAS domain S-box-containing protein
VKTDATVRFNGWRSLPIAAQIYVASVVVAGGVLVAALFPHDFPRPLMFVTLLALACVTSLWKVHLPLAASSGSTLSVSYAADLMALLLLGPRPAMLVALAGALMQCTLNVKGPYPAYRTVFSLGAESITMAATACVYWALGGAYGPVSLAETTGPLIGAITTYFLVNTGLVAAAIALSARQSIWRVWHENFLWSAPSFIVAGAAGAWAAVIVQRGEQWVGILMIAPVYLTYRTYHVFLGRIVDQQRHVEETRALHHEAVDALLQARRAEQALADEKERLAVTLRSVGDGVIATDLDGMILVLNSAAETLTGWTHDEAVGRPLSVVFRNLHADTRMPCENFLAMLGADARGLTRCTVLVARDLTERPIEERAAPLKDASGHTIGLVIAFRDMTDAIKAEEERARAGKIASLGLLAGGIAHDFNNILMAIMGNVSMARIESPLDGSAARFLTEAEQACARARQLTWQLLTFSKGGVPIKKTILLPRLLTDSASLALRGSNVNATFDIAPDLWAINADSAQLAGVFHNILVNARQAMPEGGHVRIQAENVFECESRCDYALHIAPGPYVRVSVVDAGVGIPEEHLGKIFDPYFTTKGAGSGLGLATSYSIIKNHGGCVSVDSKVRAGTTVRVYLPAMSVHPIAEAIDATQSIASLSETPRAPFSKGRVLVMDDDPSMLRMALRMLEYLGYTAEGADSGRSAIDRYSRAMSEGQRFDAVILDLVVPSGMGASETIVRLEQIDPGVKAILASGYGQDGAPSDASDAKFTAVITKPFTLEELNRTLYTVRAAPAYHVH